MKCVDLLKDLYHHHCHHHFIINPMKSPHFQDHLYVQYVELNQFQNEFRELSNKFQENEKIIQVHMKMMTARVVLIAEFKSIMW